MKQEINLCWISMQMTNVKDPQDVRIADHYRIK